jgi:putative iron-only hydrogenase system regulator
MEKLYQFIRGHKMEKKIAVIAIIVSDPSAVEKVNTLLHEYREDVIGRLGLPYREKGVSVISVVLDAEPQKLNALSGKLGMIEGVSSKTLLAK